MKTIDKKIRKAIFALVLLAVLFNIVVAEADLGPCENAFFLCMQDPSWAGASEGVFHCLLGYLFCKKYIDPVRG